MLGGCQGHISSLCQAETQNQSVQVLSFGIKHFYTCFFSRLRNSSETKLVCFCFSPGEQEGEGLCYSGTHYVDHTRLESIKICLPQSFQTFMVLELIVSLDEPTITTLQNGHSKKTAFSTPVSVP